MNQIEPGMLKLLSGMTAAGASDAFACAGKIPAYKSGGRLASAGGAPFTAGEIDAFRAGAILPESERVYRVKGSFDCGMTLDDGGRYRVNFYVQQSLPAFVARRVPSGELEFAELNLPSVLAEIAEAPRGLVIVAGAAGSGKSTTLAAMLNHINKRFNKHVVTVEDPIEFIHRDNCCMVSQREVGADTESFGEALRNVVRQSPDVILIGEMRDLDTMRTALTAALTGHLVLTTMHTSDITQAVERIINHFPDHLRSQIADDLAMALLAVAAQRLVPAIPKGLVPALEILRMTPHARNLVAARNLGELEELMKSGREEGMQTFSRALANLRKAGRITLEAGAAAATSREEFLLLAQGMESGVETFRDRLAADDAADGRVNMKWLLHSAIAHGASDLVVASGSSPCVRINGSLMPMATDPLTPADTKRLLFSVLNTRQREVFEERKEIDFALSATVQKQPDAPPSRFRVNGFYQRGTVALAVRVISTQIPKPELLGLPPVLLRLCERHQGLLLVTGPTGHGKSTTLASLIDQINERRSCHIITVEDPIEYVHANKAALVEQREVYADTLSFANALKYVLRQDPDVILVGEMRDTETIAAALTAAETGHLVLATLHTNDAAQSIDRIIDSFPSHQQNQIRLQLSGSILGIVSQRLVPTRDGKGRVAAFEVLVGVPAVRATIREGKTHLMASIIETNSKEGMITMDKAIKELYMRNLISRQDALSYMNNPQAHGVTAT